MSVMKDPAIREHAIEAVQHAAATKGAAVIGVGGATTPWWIDLILNSQYMQAIGVVMGMVLSLTIITVNIVTVRKRLQEAKISDENARSQTEIDEMRKAILRRQMEEKGIDLN